MNILKVNKKTTFINGWEITVDTVSTSENYTIVSFNSTPRTGRIKCQNYNYLCKDNKFLY